MTFSMRIFSVFLFASLFFAIASAQQSSVPDAPSAAKPQNDTSSKTPADRKEAQEKSKEEQTGTSNDRLFYALPNFLTVQTENVPPLTAKEKFKVVARGSFDYIQIPWYAFLSGISQAEDSEPGFGQGAEGYGKRFGSYFADGTIENFMTGAILPSLLREDPRFYQSGKGGFTRRSGYAISRIFITRTDAGGSTFNFSEVVGSAMSAAISTYSYHPSADRTLSNTASVWGSQVGYDTITLVVKEFWPDIRRKISKKKQPSTQLREVNDPDTALLARP